MDWLARLIAGPFIDGALKAYTAKLEAGNTRERIAAELTARELEVEKRERELAAEVLVAEQGNWFTRWVRPMWALPFVIWTWKVVIYDKVLGLGATDGLEGFIGWLGMAVAVAYFGGRSFEKTARIMKGGVR